MIAARCALVMAIGWPVMGVLFYTQNTRVIDAISRQQPIATIPDLTVLELYMSVYTGWAGPAFFVFLAIWIRIAKPYANINFPVFLVWWSGVVLFLLYLPTLMLPVCAIGLWALTTRGNERLIANVSIRDEKRM